MDRTPAGQGPGAGQRRAGVIDPLTAIATERWERRIRHGGTEYLRMYWEATEDAHRAPLIDEVMRLLPSAAGGDVLEVGCHVGTNLRVLARRQPFVRAYGVDVSPDAITFGRAEFWNLPEAERPARVDLRVGSAQALSDLPEMDVVFSCYALAYVAPDDLYGALSRMWTLARRGLVIAEPMVLLTDPREPAARVTRLNPCPEWAHDFARHARALPGAGQARVRPVTCARGDLNAVLTIPRKEPRP